MAEYLIQDTTLDAIANAINAKTGSSSAMTPAEMVTEIAAIPSGGGIGGIVNYIEYVPVSDLNASNRGTVQLTEGIDCVVVVLATAKTITSVYGAYIWIGSTFPAGNVIVNTLSRVIRPDGTFGYDGNEASFNKQTGVLTLGGQYGTFYAGEQYRIYQLEVGA